MLDPKDLGRGETGQGRLSCDAKNSVGADTIVNLITLRCGPLIIPQDGRAQDFAFCVEQHQAMHLAGEPDRRNMFRIDLGLIERFANAGDRCVIPILRRLLGPQRLRGRQRILRRDVGGNIALLIDQQRLAPAGSDVNTEKVRSHTMIKDSPRRH